MRAGTILIVIGGALLVVGVIVRYAPWLVSWFGKLPGDLRIERDSVTIFIPVMSMLVVSLLLSILLGVFNRFRS